MILLANHFTIRTAFDYIRSHLEYFRHNLVIMSKRRRIVCLESDSEDEVSPSKQPADYEDSFIDDGEVSLPPSPESEEEDHLLNFADSDCTDSDSVSESESDSSDEETGSDSEIDCNDLIHPYVYDN